MGNNGIISKLKKTLENIYSDFRSRIDPDAWKKAVSEAYSESPEDTAVQVVDFMLMHKYVPVKVWRALCYAIDMRNDPVKLSEIYSESTIRMMLDRMGEKDPLRYAYIPPSCTDEQVKYIVDTAAAAAVYLERGQIYLADTAVAGLRKFCPTHPDVLDLQKKVAEVKCTGGVSAEKDDMYIAAVNMSSRIKKAASDTDAAAAAKELENIIAEDYRCYEAYYPLGDVYIKSGELQQAEYLADLMLDLGQKKADAYFLKGRILEEKGNKAAAFFYYETSAIYKGSRAEDDRKRLLGEFEPDYEEYVAPKLDESIKRHYLDSEEYAVIEAVKETDYLIKRGRLTEAYYELVKKSEEFPNSDLLKFKKAMSLYLMRKEPEAREVFLSIKEGTLLNERARWLVEDIDNNIADNKKYESISPEILADILFNTAHYADALDIYKKTEVSVMTARMWAQRGRCEAEQGMLNAALTSLENAVRGNCEAKYANELAALIYQAKGDGESALRMYDTAITLSHDKSNIKICGLKAALLFRMEKTRELLDFRNYMENKGMPPSDADGYAGIFQIYGKPRDTDQGLKYLERAIAAGTAVPEFYTAAVKLCILKEQYFRAMRYVEKGIASAEDTEELYIQKCEVLYFLGKLESAFINAGTLLTKKPESAELHYLMGCIHSDRKQDREAVKWLTRAAELEKDSHKYAYAVADKCFELGDNANALTYYSRAIMADSEDHISFKRRALIYSMRDEDEKAVDDIKCAMLLRPDDPEIYIILGDILSDYELEEDMDLESGPDSLEKSEIKSEASEDETVKNDVLEEIQENSDKNDSSDEKEVESEGADAEKEAENEELTDPVTASDENEGSAEVSAAKEPDDLEKDSEYYYSKAISLDPSYRQAYISRAGYYIDRRRLDEALRDIQKAAEIDDSDGNVYMMRGLVYHLRNQNEDAVKDFERAAEDENLALQAYSYIAKCSNAMENYEAAMEAADKGLKIDSDFLNLYVNRGVALYNLEKYHQAIEDFKRVIQKKNEVRTAAVEAAYRFRGMTYEKLGNTEEALNDYKMLMKYDPDRFIKQRIAELESRVEAAQKKHIFSFFRKKNKMED